jgi:hypothetical protein
MTDWSVIIHESDNGPRGDKSETKRGGP